MAPQPPQSFGKTLSLKVLAAAVTKIESLRSIEHRCKVLGVQVVLRPLSAEQEVEVQEYVAPAWKDGRDQQANFAEFMDLLRGATLSHAIVQIGDLDLRDVDYLDTGEVGEGGIAISMPRSDALRALIASSWTRPMIIQVFAQYGQLLEKLDARANTAVAYDPIDLDAEIERLERRLVDLKSAKEKADRPPEDVVQQRQRAVLATQSERRAAPPRDASADADVLANEALARQQAASSPAPSAPPQQAPETPRPHVGRRSAVPEAAHAAAPPSRDIDEKIELAIDAEQPQEPAASTEIQRDDLGRSVPLGGDSFFDPSDPDAAVAMETRRQAELLRESRQRDHERAQRAQQQAEMGMPDPRTAARDLARGQGTGGPQAAARLDPRTGSLRSAANVSNAVLDGGAGGIRSGRPVARPTPGSAGAPATLHGKEVFQTRPTQVLDRPARSDSTSASVTPSVNPDAGSRNPRFRPPSQG